MVGHAFESTGAIVVACAPSLRAGEYVVLAQTETGYVVADVLVRDLPAPDHWIQGDYFDMRDEPGSRGHLDEAIAAFAKATGLDLGQATRQVDFAVAHLSTRTQAAQVG